MMRICAHLNIRVLELWKEKECIPAYVSQGSVSIMGQWKKFGLGS